MLPIAVILIVEIVAFCGLAVVRFKNVQEKCAKVYYAIWSVAIILVFALGLGEETFFSYTKLLIITLGIIAAIIPGMVAVMKQERFDGIGGVFLTAILVVLIGGTIGMLYGLVSIVTHVEL